MVELPDKAACRVRCAGCGNGAMVEPLRHRQTKGAATDMFYLTPPRHISTLPWPCKNALPREVGEKPGPGSVSGHDRSHQRLGTDDVHDPCQIIGQDRESHLGGYFWKRFGEEVCRPHAGLHRAERMLDCLATLAHGLSVCIKALLHSFEQMLMLPSRNPPLWPRPPPAYACCASRTPLPSRD